MLEEVKLELEKIKNQYPEFFKKYSSELLEFIFSEGTSSKIAEICLNNNIEDEEKIEKIASRVVSVLLEQSPKEKLSEVLEKGVGLDLETAEKISTEVNQVIFSQIKKTQLIKTKASLLTPGLALKLKEEPERPPEKDFYRE